MIHNGKISVGKLSIFLILFTMYFYHLCAFLYHPISLVYVILWLGVILLYSKMHGVRKKITVIEGLCLLTLVPFFFNNIDVKNGSYDHAIVQVAMVVTFLLLARSDYWIPIFIKFMKASSAVMVFFTVLFIISPTIKNMVLPIVFPGNTTILETSAAIGLTHHYSANGNFMAVALGAAVWLYDSNKKFYWPRIFVVFVCLLLTLKRGPLLWCIAGLLVSYYIYNSNKKTSRLFYIIVLLFGGILLLEALSNVIPQVHTLLERFQMADADASGVTFLSGREILYEAAWRLFNDNKLFGIGWGGYTRAAAQYTGYANMDTHNIYLQLLAETGIVGFSIYVVYFINTIVLGTKKLAQSRKGKINVGIEMERTMAFSLFFIVYYITYGMSGLVLIDHMLIFVFMFCVAVFRNIDDTIQK